MKQVLFVLIALIVGGARADNVVTSREYVDTQANTLQTELPAKNENTVLLNTNTAGEVGEKAIYDASADYATQSDALVTAGAFNTAVQNALESEFVCVERIEAGCLLYAIGGAGRNLFDKTNPDLQYGGYFNEDSHYRIVAYDKGDKMVFVPVQPNTTYTVSRVVPNNKYNRFRIGAFNTSGVPQPDVVPTSVLFDTYALDVLSATVTTENDTTYLGVFCRNSGAVGDDWQTFLDNFQVELGNHATPYVPYTYFEKTN